MKEILTKDAVGLTLCQDITEIVKDVRKGPRFRKGHVVTAEDVPILLDLGKEHLYVWEQTEGMLHENQAAEILFRLCQNQYIVPSEIKEGKIEAVAERDGLLEVDTETLQKINSLGEMMIATKWSHSVVKAGETIAGMRAIPLVIEETKMQQAVQTAGAAKILTLHPFKKKKVGIVTTGTEILNGRIKDTFTPVLKEKIAAFTGEVVAHELTGDKPAVTSAAIQKMLDEGAEIVLCSGGMSVDADDKTPLAIKQTGAQVVTYGTPVLPGAMFMLAYGERGQAIMGLPGSVMFSKRTVFDLILPFIMADVPVTPAHIASLGHGGLL